MKNMLLEHPEYQITTTALGTWKRYLFPTGQYYAEFTSHRSMFGLPVLHVTRGICPETGTRKIAKGVIAVGRLAAGVLAVGHAGFGLIAVGQLGIGILLGLGQASTGLYALGQVAVAALFGAGQVATGLTAIGQVAFGKYVLAQVGFGQHVWGPRSADPEAVRHFHDLYERILMWWQGSGI